MNNIVDFIIEKLRINKDTNIEKYDSFKFDINDFKEEIRLPIKIRLIDQQETEYIYKIEKKESSGHFYWQFFNRYDKVVTYFDAKTVIKFLKNKEKVFAIIHHLGKENYSRSETIKLVD